MRSGCLPSISDGTSRYDMKDTAESIMPMSMCWPGPPLARWWNSAVITAKAVNMPVVKSISAKVVFWGGWLGSPFIAM